MAKAAKTSTSLPPKKITVVVQGNIHKKFAKKLKATNSSLQRRINELIIRDLEV